MAKVCINCCEFSMLDTGKSFVAVILKIIPSTIFSHRLGFEPKWLQRKLPLSAYQPLQWKKVIFTVAPCTYQYLSIHVLGWYGTAAAAATATPANWRAVRLPGLSDTHLSIWSGHRTGDLTPTISNSYFRLTCSSHKIFVQRFFGRNLLNKHVTKASSMVVGVLTSYSGDHSLSPRRY